MARLLETQPLEFLLSPSWHLDVSLEFSKVHHANSRPFYLRTKQISRWPGRPFPAHLSCFLASSLPPFQWIPTLTRLNIFAARLQQSFQIQDFSLGSVSMQSHDLHFLCVAAIHLDWHQGFCACLILTDVPPTSRACRLRWNLSSSLLLSPQTFPMASLYPLTLVSFMSASSLSLSSLPRSSDPRVPLLLLSHQWPLTPDLFNAPPRAWSYIQDLAIYLPFILFHSTLQWVASCID